MQAFRLMIFEWFIYISAILVAWGVSLALWGGFQSWRSNFRTGLKLEERMDIEVRVLENNLQSTQIVESILRRPTHWQDCQVARIEQESNDVKSFYLVNPSGEPLSSFLPGQHIVVQRPAHPGFPQDSRCYSLSDECLAGYWRISVKRQSDRLESFSRWLHDEISIGDSLKVRGPSGTFFMKAIAEENVVLASAGIGITPMIPMMLHAVGKRYRSVRFFGQFRDPEHMPFVQSILKIGNHHPSLRSELWISRVPNNIFDTDQSIFRSGKFTAEDLTSCIPTVEFDRTSFYLCGPIPWQEQLTQGLIDRGIRIDKIHFEHFESPSGEPTNTAPVTTVAPKLVKFAKTGMSASFDSSCPSLLHCASRNQVGIDSGCRAGSCGACAVRMLEGKVRYTRDPQFRTKGSEILPCICVPETDLVVEA